MLETRGLDAFYGDFQALFGIDFEVGDGEVVAMIGANGAGKSSMMRAVTGLIHSEPEQVLWQGRPIGSMRADQVASLGIAMVPEGRQLFPSLSVEENLLIGGQIGRSGHWGLERVYDQFPVLRERKRMTPSSMSGGQQQMLAIGRALMSNPELILFDEISLGLAPIVIRQIYDVLPGIVSDGMAAVIVEQDIGKALEASDRYYCLTEGRVAMTGKTSEVTREQIAHAYFMGA